jgi:hypothetical protein
MVGVCVTVAVAVTVGVAVIVAVEPPAVPTSELETRLLSP